MQHVANERRSIRTMPQGVVEDEILRRLRAHLSTPGTKAGTVARALGVERTLIWRISVGKKISRKNRDLLADRISQLGLAEGSISDAAPATGHDDDLQQLVAHSKALLRFLLNAVETLERRAGAATTDSAD